MSSVENKKCNMHCWLVAASTKTAEPKSYRRKHVCFTKKYIWILVPLPVDNKPNDVIDSKHLEAEVYSEGLLKN